MKKINIALLLLFMTSCSKELIKPDEKFNEEEKITSPTFSLTTSNNDDYNVLGYGFDVTGEYANAASGKFKVINVDRLKLDYPNRIDSQVPLHQAYAESYGENSETYSKGVSSRVEATAGYKLFGLGMTTNFSYSNNDSTHFDAKYIYGSYSLMVKYERFRINASTALLKSYLTQEFIDDLSAKSIQQIIKDYGTHVMTDIYTGGKLDLMYQSETKNSNRYEAARIGVTVGAKLGFNIDIEGSETVNKSKTNLNFNRKLVYNTYGGNPSLSLTGSINLDQNAPLINYSSWQSSISKSNSVLVDFGEYGLIPIYELIDDPIKKNQLTNAVNQYLSDKEVRNYYGKVPVYFLYLDGWAKFRDSKMDNHVLSVRPEEEDPLLTNEGILFYTYTSQKPGTVPVHRFLNPYINNSMYTTDRNGCNGCTYIGVEFYAYPSSHSNTSNQFIPIYKYWSNYHLDNLYSTEKRNYVNYSYETVAFMVPR